MFCTMALNTTLFLDGHFTVSLCTCSENTKGCWLIETRLFRFDSGSLFTSLIPHLDDVSSKAAPEPLLFRVVELIVRQIPGIFNLRLGHILDQSKTKCHTLHTSSTFHIPAFFSSLHISFFFISPVEVHLWWRPSFPAECDFFSVLSLFCFLWKENERLSPLFHLGSLKI